jgi:predicted O-methyltransferase YrrM
MLLLYPETQSGESTSYLLCDDKGRIISSSSPSISDHHESFHAEKDESLLDQLSFGQEFADLIEPLFSLPMKLPMTAWAGHIPFLMTLIKLMRPRTFVELGTHFGASLIGAATASKSFNVPMKLYAIDSWEGDEHAGFYNGDDIFRDLRSYTNARFNNVELIRSYFDDANARFAPGSIDILHIDGLHTYEAVKHDFLSWLPKMAPDGVILFHDVCVHERGFGVYQLWEELQEKFDTMTFSHSFGLGVCLLDSQSPRIGSIGRLARNKKTAQFYSALVAQIGGLLHSRMHYLDLQENGRESERDAYRQIANLKERVSTLESAVQKLEDRKDVQGAIIRDMKSELLFYQQQSRIGFGDK